MSDALQALQAALPYVGMLLMFAAFWRMTNATVTLQWSAKTQEPEPSKDRAAQNKAERDAYARRQIAELTPTIGYDKPGAP